MNLFQKYAHSPELDPYRLFGVEKVAKGDKPTTDVYLTEDDLAEDTLNLN